LFIAAVEIATEEAELEPPDTLAAPARAAASAALHNSVRTNWTRPQSTASEVIPQNATSPTIT
jgi:hypothetical protein